jgi:hypothetical protein
MSLESTPRVESTPELSPAALGAGAAMESAATAIPAAPLATTESELAQLAAQRKAKREQKAAALLANRAKGKPAPAATPEPAESTPAEPVATPTPEPKPAAAPKPARKPKASAKPAAAPKAPKGKPAAESKPEPVATPKSAFGARMGTGNAALHGALTSKPASMGELLSAAGLNKPYRNELARLVELGMVERVELESNKVAFKLTRKGAGRAASWAAGKELAPLAAPAAESAPAESKPAEPVATPAESTTAAA